MSGVSTHVLDTASGCPVANIAVQLFRDAEKVGDGTTNADGRCPALLPEGVVLQTGIYRIVFDLASRFPGGFYPEVCVSFRVVEPSANYHVPLLVSPFGYTTYRGS